MPLERIKRIVDEVAVHKKEVERIIPYMNNEPFLDARIIEILRYIKERGIFVELSTNASVLDKAYTEQIVEEKLIDDFRISFFSGFASTYKTLMPGLDYVRTLENIKYFLNINRKKGNPVPVQIIQVMYKGMDLEAEKLKMKELFPDVEIHYFGYLDRAGNMEYKNELAVKDYSKASLQGCSLLRLEERFTITSRGNVILCSQDWLQKEIIGNVNKNEIQDIFLGNERREQLEKLYGQAKSEDSFLCKNCKLAKIQYYQSGQIVQNFKGDHFMYCNDKKVY